MRILYLLIALAMTVPAFPQSMKMVVDADGNVIGRYMKTNADSYTVGVQDIFDVPKSGNRVVTYRARKGQGVIWCKNVGQVEVYGSPGTKGEVIGHLVYEDGYTPETYQCLGKKRGWYKVMVNGRIGFVRSNLVEWDGIATF